MQTRFDDVNTPEVTRVNRQPVITGPINGGRGRPYSASIVDLDRLGYTEAEFFVSGRATTYVPAEGTTLGVDGRWRVAAGDDVDVPFTTRILVRRPPAERFNGTVIVEFMQEYFGSERDTNYRWNAETILREGFAWVGASLHREGIDSDEAGEFEFQGMRRPYGPGLRQWDLHRYAPLNFPDSDLCYDVLGQIGHAVGPRRGEDSIDPLVGLDVQRVVAVGNTIAADRLQHYINAVHRTHRVFDGYCLQDLNESGVRLNKSVPSPPGLWLRTDVEVPVIVLNTMTAAVKAPAQPEGQNLRFWEPAGSSHSTGPFMVRMAVANKRDFGAETPVCDPDYANNLPVQYISGAALVALHRWLADGQPAPGFPRLQCKGTPPEQTEEVDEYGNALGGVRSPWVEVPTARYDWRGECFGFAGRTFPFTADQLTELYGEPATYHKRFADAATAARKSGVLLAADAEQAVEAARKVTW